MEKDKVQNDKVQPSDEISNEDLDKVAGGTTVKPTTQNYKTKFVGTQNYKAKF